MGTKNFIANFGGIFIYSARPAELADWYKEALGIEFIYNKEYNNWYYTFSYTDTHTGKEASAVWSILENKNRPDIKEKIYTINYRITDLDELVSHLKSIGFEPKPVEEYGEMGKFSSITDPDGNLLELWEDTKLK